MNSRQRRKIAATNHNALLIENEAYREDKIRDPEKYKRNETQTQRAERRHIQAILAITLGTISGYTPRGSR